MPITEAMDGDVTTEQEMVDLAVRRGLTRPPYASIDSPVAGWDAPDLESDEVVDIVDTLMKGLESRRGGACSAE